MNEYRNSMIEHIISEYIHSDRDAAIMRDRLIHGLTYDNLADKHYLSVSTIKRIIYKNEAIIFKHYEP